MFSLRNACVKTARIVESFCAKTTGNVLQQSRVCFSSGPPQQQGTFYEFRTYCIRPDKNASFLKLTNEKIHLRTAHSELVGYWTVEYGALNQVVHIWKYDGYSMRAGVRAALAQDPKWIEDYISVAMPMLTLQDNEVTSLAPWTPIHSPPKQGGVYELCSFHMRPGGPGVWEEAFRSAGPGSAHLVGVFHTEAGLLDTVHSLWWHDNADQRAAADRDARLVTAVKQSGDLLVSQRNKLMFPCAFSPLK